MAKRTASSSVTDLIEQLMPLHSDTAKPHEALATVDTVPVGDALFQLPAATVSDEGTVEKRQKMVSKYQIASELTVHALKQKHENHLHYSTYRLNSLKAITMNERSQKIDTGRPWLAKLSTRGTCLERDNQNIDLPPPDFRLPYQICKVMVYRNLL